MVELNVMEPSSDVIDSTSDGSEGGSQYPIIYISS